MKTMYIDYEELILIKQELIEIWEDDPESPFLQAEDEWWNDIPDEDFVTTYHKVKGR